MTMDFTRIEAAVVFANEKLRAFASRLENDGYDALAQAIRGNESELRAALADLKEQAKAEPKHPDDHSELCRCMYCMDACY